MQDDHHNYCVHSSEISGGSRGVSLVSIETPFQILMIDKSSYATPTSML